MTEPSEGSLVFLSGNDELDLRAVDRAKELLQKINTYSNIAMDFARTHGTSVWDGKGNLALEAVDITDILEDGFGLTFGVEGQPDFTVTVEFRDGHPKLVWGAD